MKHHLAMAAIGVKTKQTNGFHYKKYTLYTYIRIVYTGTVVCKYLLNSLLKTAVNINTIAQWEFVKKEKCKKKFIKLPIYI